MNIENFKPGIIISPEDERDLTMEKVGIMCAPLLHDYNLPWVAPVKNQGSTNKCAAFSMASLLEQAYYMLTGKHIELSIDWIYNVRPEGQYRGEGMYIVEMLKNRTRLGVPRLSLFKTGVDSYVTITEEVFDDVYPDAVGRCIKAFVRLRSAYEILAALKTFGTSVILGLMLYESFFQTGSNGIVPPPSGKIVGGHAMQIVGIKQIDGVWRLTIPNTWGDAWGDKGYCYLDITEHKGFELWGIMMPSKTPKTEVQQLFIPVGKREIYVDNKLVKMPIAFQYLKNEEGESKLMGPVREMYELFGEFDVRWYRLGDGTYTEIKRAGLYIVEEALK